MVRWFDKKNTLYEDIVFKNEYWFLKYCCICSYSIPVAPGVQDSHVTMRNELNDNAGLCAIPEQTCNHFRP